MGQKAEIEWRSGAVPVSARFDDPYFSLENGLAETAHVFLDGNALPARFAPGFHIAELGFGTGLNLLAALRLWRMTGQQGTLRFTTFEAYPMAPTDMRAAHAAFPELAALSAELVPLYATDTRRISLPDLDFHLIEGDARETLPQWQTRADAWFLDGFAPAKNPELWEAPLLAQVANHTAPNGTAATYTAAGFVRRALADAGFTVSRRAGFGRKRHMTIARMSPDE
ncbi:tRNA (5-methylaminomethyl-2-thiouridine)(34)-methyltransferase MnmD [Aquicoccus sp. G2-2]|uniref:tRNA (5-methylaminomethyl-2-thiouridine)(34)-methyltransferase MnmD n=1 Tax=Aquicoccus sp. G2-2 TaxID=3092120 RepID=UPI002ADF3364|nr:tRNA (5-methylaminomethyl-2-thiouridine)(34)-methyltransferase MnmD [Aquicoccus sp. G2-2]MEA1114415.1 tRNA (5-methylaminomethyl-2-thiouridine)(34)-methyltransferase MnmD [Aquicoccus sp. G2-2]